MADVAGLRMIAMISSVDDESFEEDLRRLCRKRAPESSVFRRLLSRRGRLVLVVLLQIARPIAERIAARELDTELRSKVDPEDVVQETLLSFTLAYPTIEARTRGQFLRLLVTLLRNRLEDQRRRYRRSQKRNIRRERSIEFCDGREAAELIAPLSSPLQAAIDEEICERLEWALERLPSERRKALEFRYLEGLPWDEIGKMAGLRGNAMRMRVERWLLKLRNEIGTHDSSSA